ncbi:hypothetical protein KSP39_PZI004607 [Platanthera zijinensis]|uniref:Plastid lipid-associated protein/fibrillin conserved domain-containing protein n=1 Tax=Platanthera zijinensis TaxID=2320716 RepID=A0AAP0GCW2_9ASPA
MQIEGSSFAHGRAFRRTNKLLISQRKLMAATASMLRPALHLRLTQASPAASQGLRPSPVGLEMKQRPCKRRVAAIDVQAVAGGQEVSSSGDGMDKTAEEIKAELYLALQGIDRGIFGLSSAKKVEIEAMVEQLESRNPTPNPTDHLLSKVDGCWKLIYTTVTILGSKRTRLGLRDFIRLGDIYQTIDAAQELAVNVVHFSVKGMRMLAGRLTIRASYTIASKSIRASFLIGAANSMEQFAGLFEKNYDLLIAVFNPEGWLDITYVDESMRIGRAHKGSIFVLERTTKNAI